MYRGQGLLRDDLVMKFLINTVIFKYEVLFLFFDWMALDFSMNEGGFRSLFGSYFMLFKIPRN